MNTKPCPAAAASGATPRPIRVLAVDDSPLFLHGLRRLLALHPLVELVGATGSTDEVLHLAEALRPDLILTDLNMPAADGLEIAALLRRRLPMARIIVLTLEDAARNRCRAAGAHGFVDKARIASDLIGEIRRLFPTALATKECRAAA